MYLFINGVIAMGCGVAAFFFQRLARRTSDRLFVYFGIAFALFAVERLVLSFAHTPEESTPSVYLLRLAGFLCIIVAIVSKNVEAKKR